MMKKSLFLGIFILLFASFVSAASNLSITGATQDLSGNISETVYGNFTLDNIGTDNLTNVVFSATQLTGIKSNITGISFNPQWVTLLNSTDTPVIDFSINIPSNAYQGLYTGTITANASESGNYNSFNYNLTVAQNPNLNVGSATINVVGGESASATINLQNTGNIDLSVLLGNEGINAGKLLVSYNLSNPITVNYGETVPVKITVVATEVSSQESHSANITADYASTTKKSTLSVTVSPTNPALTANNIPEATVIRGTSEKAYTNVYLSNTGNTDLTGITFSKTNLAQVGNSSNTISSNYIKINNAASLDLAAGANSNVPIEITPSTWAAGTYRGNVTASHVSSNISITKELTLKVREGAASLEVPSTVYLGSESSQERNQTVSGTFAIKNTGLSGDNTISNFEIYTNANSKYKVNFSIDGGSTYTPKVSGFSLGPGQSKTIHYKGYIPADMDGESTDIGDIFIYNDQVNKTITSFLINTKSMLTIKDFKAEIDGNTDSNIGLSGDEIGKKAYPGSKVRLSTKLENHYSRESKIDLEDVKIKITIVDIDDDEDLEAETSTFSIRYDSPSDFKTLDFDIPYKVEEGTYDVLIEVEGEDEEYNSLHKDSGKVLLKVEKKSHKLRIMKAKLGSEEINCDGLTTLDVLVANIGDTNEAKSVLTVKNTKLGLDYKSSEIELLEDPDRDDNEFSKVFSIDLRNKNLTEGIYPIEINIYYSTDVISDTKTVDLTVKNCEAKAEEEQKETEDGTVVLEQEAEGITGEGGAIAQEVYTETTESSFIEGSGYVVLLVLGNLIIIAVAVLLVFKFLLAPKQ